MTIAFWFTLQAMLVGVEQSEDPVLTTAMDVISLTGEEAAQSIPVSLTGVVTVSYPHWGGRFFVQDETSGIFVDSLEDERPMPGDRISLSGLSYPGGFAPSVFSAQWKKTEEEPLPVARVVPIEVLLSGAEDSQRVEVTGVVRTATLNENELSLYLVSDGHRLQALLPPATVTEPQSLIGATVRVRGTAAATFNGESRQVISMNLFVPVSDDFLVVQREKVNPLEKEVLLIGALGKYSRAILPHDRVRLRGVVTYQQLGEELFIQDETGGLHVRSSQLIDVERGALVEVVGFPGAEDNLPVLQDASIRLIEGSKVPEAFRFQLEELKKSHRFGQLVSLKAILLDRSVRMAAEGSEGQLEERVTLMLEAEDEVFTADGSFAGAGTSFLNLEVGSQVNVEGICSLDIRDDGEVTSFQILLPDAESVTVLVRPSWLNARRLKYGLGILGGVVLLFLIWAATLARKNQMLKRSIEGRARAQAELQKVNETLDLRVQERTAQLKSEMDERKKAEVSFKATLAERTRLAQELHDTTEQSLAGIGLQLDTSAKLLPNDLEEGLKPLDLARTLIGQSHQDLRRSIWNLRSRELEEFNFSDAVRMSVREVLLGTGIEFEKVEQGVARSLPEVVEENLLRVVREVATNAVKHADASKLEVTLSYREGEVELTVSDDGRGFSSESAPGAKEGHFGLLGISERVKRFDGILVLDSKVGQGTTVRVTVSTARLTSDVATAQTNGMKS
ncbi:MAG: histidine kinase [Roseibacillus sp.]